MKKWLTLENLHLLLGAHIVLWLNAACYGFVGDRIPSSIKMGLVALWVAISLLRSKHYFSTFAVTGYLMGIFYFMCFLSRRSEALGYFDQYGMNILYILIMIAVFSYYFYYGTREEIKFLLIIFLLDVAIITVRTSIKLQEMPTLARIISTSSESKMGELGGNIPKAIGGYGLCYELVLMQPILSYILNKHQTKWFIKFLIYGFILFFLFQAQITLAFLMYPVMVLLCYTHGQRNEGTISITHLLLIVATISLVVAAPALLEMIIETAESHLAERLKEVLGFLTEEQVLGGDTQARLELYTESLTTFSNNPIWGVFGRKGYGSHSTLLDMLAAYGVVGLTGYFGMFRPIKLTKKYLRNQGTPLSVIKTTHLAAIFISIVNVLVGVEIMLTLVVFVPLAAKYFMGKDDEKKEEISREVVSD